MERRKDKKIRTEVEHALQRRDIEDLIKEVRDGFKGTHERQDTTNGKVLKAGEDIIDLKNSRSFYKGGLAVLTAVVIPLAFIVAKYLLER